MSARWMISVLAVGISRPDSTMAAEMLAQQTLADDHRIKWRDVGPDRQPVERRGGDERHLAHPGQGQLQGARNWRRGQRQHMNTGPQLLQPLLVLDAEVLLLIND